MNGGFMWGEQRFVYTSLAKALSKSSMISSRISGTVHDGRIYPALQGTLVHVLPYNILSSLTLNIGYPQTLILTTSKTYDWGESSLSLQFRPQAYPLLSLGSSYRIDKAHKVEMKLTTSGDYAKVKLALCKQWSQLYESVAGLHVSEGEGVVLKLSVIRDKDYKLTVPLHLSEGMSASSILVGAALPVIAGFLTDWLIVRPYQRYIEKSENRSKHAEIKARVDAEKAEAEMAILVLHEAYVRKKEAEEQSNGLVVLEASYKSESADWDVTVPLQVLVHNGTLELSPSSKSHLAGFYNLDPGNPKRLEVKYNFRGKAHRATVSDHEVLLLPQRDHLIRI
jgi:DnaJ family protein C protein 11